MAFPGPRQHCRRRQTPHDLRGGRIREDHTLRISRRSFVGGTGVLAVAAASGPVLPGTAHADTAITTNQTGTDNGFYYSFSTTRSGPTAADRSA
ncbi:twin-arginine translocation signal domain-containing protein [Streptomyces sp. NPDC051041]|uniref:twin-arginine translocation signal domain-containing protein n=1 Tax=Streptomyces sp. NPDC051041 TaxID=3365640 RepID=UPI0037A91121